jgi:ER-bound oxygenase mpaB/B'/Rubber oxygenase, catalytic domain
MNSLAEKWSDSFLTGMRRLGDPLADATVAAVFREGQVEALNRLLMDLVRNDQMVPTELPEVVQGYLRDSAALPEWDEARIDLAQQVFVRHGNLLLLVLLCASLPECYVMKKGVKVLWLTQRLKDHVFRRLLETCQMVLAVMTPGGLSGSGRGIRAAQKVRLMHAAIRHLIMIDSPGEQSGSGEAPKDFSEVLLRIRWDRDALGVPINQEDMAYTLLTFSYVIARGLETVGVTLSAEEKDAFVYCWNVVGRIMGIREDLLAGSFAEAEYLFGRCKELEGGYSDEAAAMTRSLLECIQDVLPGHTLDRLPVHLLHELVGPATAAMLGVKPLDLVEKIAIGAVIKTLQIGTSLKSRAFDHLVFTPALWRWLSNRLVERLTNLRQPPGWNRGVFRIPEELAANWQAAE